MGFQRAAQPAHRPAAEVEADPVGEHQADERIAGGPIPGVHDHAGGGGDRTASERAYLAAADDANTIELKTKVGGLVQKKFGGDYKAAFDHYDGDKDGGVGSDELKQLLADADVGNRLTRGAWVKGILEKVDADKDGRIQYREFESVFTASA